MDSIFFSALADIFLSVKFSHLSIQIFFFFFEKKGSTFNPSYSSYFCP